MPFTPFGDIVARSGLGNTTNDWMMQGLAITLYYNRSRIRGLSVIHPVCILLRKDETLQ